MPRSTWYPGMAPVSYIHRGLTCRAIADVWRVVAQHRVALGDQEGAARARRAARMIEHRDGWRRPTMARPARAGSHRPRHLEPVPGRLERAEESETLMHGFWWHFWHDPMRDNPWSLGALVLGSVAVVLLFLLPRRRP